MPLKTIVKSNCSPRMLCEFRAMRSFARLPLTIKLRFLINRYILIKRILKHPPIQLAIPGSSPGLHLLACHAHVLISLYALCSWYQNTGLSTPLIIHDDGSLSSEDVEIYQRIFPAGRLIMRSEADESIAHKLSAYPQMRAWRQRLCLALKVLDMPLLAPTEMFVLFDSDLYFFQCPKMFLRYLEPDEDPASNNVFGYNPVNAYSLARWQVKAAVGIDLPDRINSGFGLVHRSSLDLDIANRLLSSKDLLGYPGWMEQTIWAVLSARRGLEMLPEHDYTVMHDRAPRMPVMKHYVSTHRQWFYAEAIHAFLAQNGG